MIGRAGRPLMLLAGRLAGAAGVILGASLLVFLVTHVIAGDPVEVMLGEMASAADRAELRRLYGLDQPLARQMLTYYADLSRFDLGDSLLLGRPVSELIGERLPATALLALAAWVLAALIALPLGVVAALRAGGVVDRFAMGLSMLGVSLPNFWLGPMLVMVFSIWLGWLPVSGFESASALLLPAVTLGSGLAAVLARMVRGSLLETLGADYVRTARAKGIPPWRVVWVHALRNALLPVITVMGLQLGAILGGAVIVETVFAWPGLGGLVVEAIQGRDYPLVQGAVLVLAAIYVVINSLTDLLYSGLDPRIRRSGG